MRCKCLHVFIDGLHLDDDPRHIITAERTGTSSLILDGLTVEDSGQYVCYATSSMGNASTLAKVTVEGKCMVAAKSRPWSVSSQGQSGDGESHKHVQV